MKILFVLDHYYPYIGGAETLFKNLCEGLVKNNHKVVVVTTRIAKSRNHEMLNGVEIYRVWVPPVARRYWFTLNSIPRVLKEAKKADLIHTTTYNSALSSRIAGKFLNKPHLISILEVIASDWGKVPGISKSNAFVHRLMEKLVLGLNFDRYICISESTRKNVIKFGIPSKKTYVNYPGIDYKLFNPQNIDINIRSKLGLENIFIYLFFGRPGITKGVEYLINAVPKISKYIPKSKLVMILAHEPKKRYEEIIKLIRKLRLGKKIILIDPVERKLLPSYLGIANCVVVPSLTEGFGYSAAESCALGLNVVATKIGSLPEVVSGKYVLIKAKSSEAIFNGVYKIYRGKYKKTILKKFTQNATVKGIIKVYEDLIREYK